MAGLIKNFLTNNSGATAIEYSIIAGLIALVIISGAAAIGGKLTGTFNEVAGNIK